MAQSTITSFFANRKRPAAEDPKSRNKVMIMDADAGYVETTEKNTTASQLRLKSRPTVVFKNDGSEFSSPKQRGTSAVKSTVSKKTSSRRQLKAKEANQPDMKSFLNQREAETEVPDDGTSAKEANSSELVTSKPSPPNVLFEVKGLLSPRKNITDESSLPVVEQEAPEPESSKLAPPGQDTKESTVQAARKELSLGDIKSRLNRSARLTELQASMARIQQGQEKLKKIQESKRKLFESDDTSKTSHVDSETKPQLNQFRAIQLEVPVSPSKSPLKSPFKSPLKGSPGPSSPAFKRYSSLILPGTPALPLPYNYRHLAELFRCVDTVTSLLFNRNELVTFPKLQPAVQEMSRKTFTTQHIAQILTVYPEAYSVKQEKFHRFGSPTKHDKYTLVLTPLLPETTGDSTSSSVSMTPTVLLERRRHFYNRLIEIVKKHHEDFLDSLDPPMVIPMHKLTRWHPEFIVDEVPDIVPSALPKPPNQEKCSSAKDVLEKARQLYSCNSRMEKALETVAQNSATTVNVKIVDAQPSPSAPPSSPFKNLQLSSALKGIPKALLEKVRARQAAKALVAMTRTPAQEKEATQYSRLPEIAKILRNIYVAEKKGILPLDLVIEKVGDSYRSALPPRELEEHLRLLAKAVPGWLSFEHLLKTDYVKLSKGGDMNRVLTRLRILADEKAGTKS